MFAYRTGCSRNDGTGGFVDVVTMEAAMSELPDPELHKRPLASGATPPTSEHREGRDAGHSAALRNDPSDCDAKLDIELDETFPTSDPPSNTQPGRGGDPAPSSGFTKSDELPLDVE